MKRTLLATAIHHLRQTGAGSRMAFRFACLLALGLLAACTNEGATYVKKHPELNPVQSKIIASGRIPNGTAVAGLTRDQIRMAMGVDPYTIDRDGEEDVWVFTHKKAVSTDPQFADTAASGQLDKAHGFTETDPDQRAPRMDVDVKTKVYFQGNIATHAQTVEEKAQ